MRRETELKMSNTFRTLEPQNYDLLFEIKYWTKGFKVELDGEPSTNDDTFDVWKITYNGNTLFSYVINDEISHFKSFSGSDPTEILHLIEYQFKTELWDDDTSNLIKQMKSDVES